ncbi:high affinity nitrate transporter 2.7 [Impatiens glandulifera]|uniref:high affinity nitrate transporter 2.7 n=1 Tax=Impatiens glandulifera TaxID=253017 RepID=UPI001FB0B73E|nr:high affinity nitrate transporter 2.7 [Impatiens glandulifera]
MEPENQNPYSINVDSDLKATEFRLFSISSPHMKAFHLAWFSLFACFFSTFSIPPLLAVIRQDINLSDSDIGTAGIASFLGSIFSRLAMGPICDFIGPRTASAVISILTAPAILSMSFVSTAKSFILIRFFIGFSLANFIANQFWMSCMFSGNVVGLANGFAAGWANVGGGFTQLIMPLIYSFISNFLNIPSSTAWRISFIFPAIFQILTAVLVLTFGQDLPDGKYKRPPIRNSIDPINNKRVVIDVILNGFSNYRGWILGLIYGSCFGVELTTDNILAGYFYNRFGVDVKAAGAIAASFGLMNLVSRPGGGVISDEMGRRFGMRGRLWGLWIVLAMAGAFCVLLGRVNSLWGSVIVMCLFSLFVQAASGLTFGVVPFVSKRSLGVISGMTGCGGTVGAVVTQLVLFSGSQKFSTQEGISLMGIFMIASSMSIGFIYFPHLGGMFCAPNSLYPSDPNYHLLH